MSLQLLLYPHSSLSTPTKFVEKIDEDTISLIQLMKIALKTEHAKGIAANMFGIDQSIIIIEYPDNEECLVLINPKITYFSSQTQTIKEASICLPGVAAEITRPSKITVTYTNINNENIELEAEGMLATIIQHEMDYLAGKIYIDHLSKLKKDLLVTKFKKFIKTHVPHVHSASCTH